MPLHAIFGLQSVRPIQSTEVQQPERAETQVQQSEEAGAGLGHPEIEDEPGQPEYSEVESVLNKRVKGDTTQYKVKWKGWNNRYNCWRDQSDLECKELIDKYEDAYLGLSQPEVMQCVLSIKRTSLVCLSTLLHNIG